nr:MAG TPA: hypothetical protein [Caudoviricetes sp.]
MFDTELLKVFFYLFFLQWCQHRLFILFKKNTTFAKVFTAK